MIGEIEMKGNEKNSDKKQMSLSVKIMAGFLAALMLAGTVFGVLAYMIF